jgi:CRISPR locus-related DNA-binding protein
LLLLYLGVLVVRIFVAPLGFHEDILLRSLTRLGARSGDLVLVVTCLPMVSAVKRAWESLRALSSKQGLPEPRLLELSCEDFYEAFRQLRRALSELPGGDVYFCAGGGLRILTLLAICAFAALRKPFAVYYEPEAEGARPLLIPREFFENTYRGLGRLEERVLKQVLSSPGVTTKELSQALRLKEKTVRNVLARLKKRGLVARRGRREAVEPTPLALALWG